MKINKPILTAAVIVTAVSVSTFGTAAMSATTDGGLVESDAYVQQNAEIKLNCNELKLGMGEVYSLNVKTGDAASVSWTSDNTSVVEADDTGKMTAVGLGETTVSAQSSDGAADSCKISVLSEPTSMSLNQTSLTLGVGETYDLNSKLPSGTAARSIVYTSDNPEVASVKAAGGLVTANTTGTAVITATAYNGVKVSCKVEVKSAPQSISLNQTSLTLGVGETYDLNSKLPSGTAAHSIVYTSDNPEVASVKAAGGLVTANTTGTAVITATAYNGVKVSCQVEVKTAPKSISLNQTSLTLGVGETYDLNSKIPSGTAAHSIVYTSSNSKVASVKAAGGLVTANTTGTAVITATAYNGVKVSCKIEVKSAPKSISLNQTSLTLGVGKTYDLNSKLPSGTAAHSIVYTSSNSKVASVKAAGGLVTANTTGTAVITATAYNGVKVSCTVKVSNSGFTVRTTTPDISNLNYRPTNMGGYNPFTGSLSMFPSVHGRGYGKGNCTAYAWGRVCEVYGKSVADKLPRGNAGSWYYSYSGSKGSTPKAGAVAVWSGHVAFVEEVNGSTITISESGYTSCVFRTQTGTPYSLGYYGSFIGYIYP